MRPAFASIIFTCTTALAAQDSRPVGQGDLSAQPVPLRADARMTLRLAGAISPDDLRRYQRILALAAPQQLFMQAAHQRYLDVVSTSLQTHFAKLDALNAEASQYVLVPELAQEGITWASVRATEAVYDLQDVMEAEQLTAESVFFAELDSVLGDSQRVMFPRVLDDRKRARCTSRAYRVIRSSWVDLSAVVQQYVHDSEVLDAVDVVLRAYEERLTPLTVALEAELREQDRTLPRLMVWRERDDLDKRLPEDLHIQRSVESIAMQRGLVARGADLQAQIALLNDNTLPILLDRLPGDSGAAVLDFYRQTSFPAVYPDWFERGFAMCDKALALADLDESQLAAIRSVCETYRSGYAGTCDSMEARCREWQEFYANSRFTLDRYEPYRAAMRELRDRRWQYGLTLARQLKSLVPADVGFVLHQLADEAVGLIEYGRGEANSPNDRYPGL